MYKIKYFEKISRLRSLPAVIIICSLIIIAGLFILPSSSSGQTLQTNKNITYPAAKFAVIADPHVFAVEGNIGNNIYLKYGVKDRELLSLSPEILEKTVDEIIKENGIDFVLLAGDLTDSGDITSHNVVAGILNKLQQHGINVYTIPGNHDGFNTKDFRNTTIPREIITPEGFVNTYNNCGYGQAVYRDDSSLSYVAEPIEGLWLVMIDSCIYNSPNDYHVCNGRVKESTKTWINNILKKADTKNKAVIGVLHHSLLEHYNGHQRFFAKYIVDDFTELSAQFARQNMKIVFTGHHHAQDIVKKEFDDSSFIYDIETASLIGFPNAYRIVEINQNNEMTIKSKYIREMASIDSKFTSHTKNYVQGRVKGVAEEKLDKFHLNPIDKDKISDNAAEAIMAHYMGNEQAPDTLNIEGLNIWSNFIYSFYKKLLASLYNDPVPRDLNIIINLDNGEWINLDN